MLVPEAELIFRDYLIFCAEDGKEVVYDHFVYFAYVGEEAYRS